MDIFSEVDVMKVKEVDASGANKRLQKKFLQDEKVASSLSDETRQR
jgi:hypothetical protein